MRASAPVAQPRPPLPGWLLIQALPPLSPGSRARWRWPGLQTAPGASRFICHVSSSCSIWCGWYQLWGPGGRVVVSGQLGSEGGLQPPHGAPYSGGKGSGREQAHRQVLSLSAHFLAVNEGPSPNTLNKLRLFLYNNLAPTPDLILLPSGDRKMLLWPFYRGPIRQGTCPTPRRVWQTTDPEARLDSLCLGTPEISGWFRRASAQEGGRGKAASGTDLGVPLGVDDVLRG